MRPRLTIALGVAVLVLGWLVYELSRPVALSNAGRRRSRALATGARSPRLAARAAKVESKTDVQFTNVIARLMRDRDDFPKLTAEQIEPYLQQNHRNAESLLAAFRATGDRAYLLEAMEKYPNDPRVDLFAYFRGVPHKDTIGQPAAEDRRKWLDTLKQSAPDNALADYLSARDHFKAGQSELGMQEVLAAAGKSDLQDYMRDSILNTEEAYRCAGYSEAEAKAVAMQGMVLTQWTELMKLGGDLMNLANSYHSAGDESSRQNMLQLATTLGQRLDEPNPLTVIPTLASLSIQREVLKTMDPDAPCGTTGQTVRDRLAALNQRYNELQTLGPSTQNALLAMTDRDVISYFERTRLFGEEAALRWALSKYAPAPAGE